MRLFLFHTEKFLRYVFAPNPGHAAYGDSGMLFLIGIALALLVLALMIRSWRSGIQNPITKRLSRSWSAASFWFGVAALVLVVCRVEQIQFLAMRLLWVLWWVGVLFYVFFQVRQFRARHYKVLPAEHFSDPREKYLPGKRKR